MSQQFKLQILTGLYVAAMLGANLLGSKIWEISYPQWLQNVLHFLDFFQFHIGSQTVVPFSSQSLSFSVGLFVFPLTFVIMNSVTEVAGKKIAKQIFLTGLIALVFITLYAVLAVAIPPANRYNVDAFKGAAFTKNEAYTFIFSSSIRILIGSFTAFATAQLFNIWLFDRIRARVGEKFLWLRNNLADAGSHFVDTTVFYSISFIQLPFAIPFLGIEAGSGLPLDLIVKLFVPYYILKLFASAINTPLVYLAVTWLKKDVVLNSNVEIANQK